MSERLKLFLTGGSSYLGRHLVPLARSQAELLYTYYSQDPLDGPEGRQLDLRDGAAVQAAVSDFAPDVIVHMAGSNRGADMVNVIEAGTRHVVAAAQAVGARLLHLSSDVVFNGLDAPYRESDPPAPIHDYGRAKARAEELVSAYSNHVIVRTSLIYGLEEMDHATRWARDTMAAGQPVTLFTDQIRNPVWTDSLCGALLELAESDYAGILHVAGSENLSRAEFGLKLFDYWGITERQTLTLAPGGTSRWPADCRLDIRLAQQLLQTPLPGVSDILRRG